MRLKIFRYFSNDKQTQSIFLLSKEGEPLCRGYMLELPWRENESNVSCIPPGEYCLKPRFTDDRGHHFMFVNVPDRTYILIHSGNYNHDTHGCLLPGTGFTDINEDGLLDVVSSREKLNQLVRLIGDREILATIFDCQ